LTKEPTAADIFFQLEVYLPSFDIVEMVYEMFLDLILFRGKLVFFEDLPQQLADRLVKAIQQGKGATPVGGTVLQGRQAFLRALEEIHHFYFLSLISDKEGIRQRAVELLGEAREFFHRAGKEYPHVALCRLLIDLLKRQNKVP